MHKCPLCGKPADKKNAHLIPWFIIKHYITEGGTGDRDKELSFSISDSDFTRMYAGRSVLPEKLEEFANFQAAEKETENPYSRNFLWCHECENKFSRLEAIFSTRFQESKVKANAIKSEEYNGNKLFIDNHYSDSLFQLFIQSIFWRCEVGKFGVLELHSKILERINHNLQNCFSLADFGKIKANQEVSLPYSFPVLSVLLNSEAGEDPTSQFIMTTRSKKPYFIMAGKWLFLLFKKVGHIKGKVDRLYGLTDGVDIVNLYPKVSDKSHVVLLNASLTGKFKQNRMGELAESKIRGLQKNFQAFHSHFFGKHASEEIIGYLKLQYFKHKDLGASDMTAFRDALMDLKKL